MATLHRNPHFIVQHLRASGCVRILRSKVPFETAQDAQLAVQACQRAVARLPCEQLGLLMDLRDGPISTNSDLHKVLTAEMDRLAKPFRRRAILVGSSVGAMQVNRVGRSLSDASMTVFNDEQAALAFVTSS